MRERDLAVAVAVARARGVVHHQHRRHASHAFEHHRQTRTQAFGVLPGHRHRVAHVRVWQRGHQEMHRALHTGHVRQSDAEIDLHHAQIPLKTQIPVRAFPVRLAPFLHVTAHHAVRAVEPMLGHQPVEDPPGRVPLLARHIRSASSIWSINAAYASVLRPNLLSRLGWGEQSSCPAYLATVPRSTPNSRAMRACGMPCRSYRLISCCIGIAIAMFLSSRARPAATGRKWCYNSGTYRSGGPMPSSFKPPAHTLPTLRKASSPNCGKIPPKLLKKH